MSWLRRRARYAEVAPGLWQGPMVLEERDLAELREAGVTRVLNLCEDVEYEPGERETLAAAFAGAGIVEERLPSLDHGGLLPGLLEQAVRRVGAWLDEGETVAVHCMAGQERSAAVAAAVVAAREDLAPREAVTRVRRAQPSARPLPHQVADLERWWAARRRSAH